MLLTILLTTLLTWYIGYLIAFHLMIEKTLKEGGLLNKVDIHTIKHMCKLSWLWIFILILDKNE